MVALQHLLRFSFWLRLIEVEVGDSCDMRSRHVHRAEGIGVQYLLLGCAVFAVCSVHILDFVTTSTTREPRSTDGTITAVAADENDLFVKPSVAVVLLCSYGREIEIQ